jgi:hypothetical protein
MGKKHNLVGKYLGAMNVKFKIGFGAFVVFLSVLSACDKITNPIISKNTYSTLPSTPPDKVTKTTDSTTVKVLLEDYMGHFCVNCPAAVSVAEGLINSPSTGPHIVSMEVNAGYFADPANTKGGPLVPGGLPDTAYANDYRTAAGTAWTSQFLINNGGIMPQGMVNRIYYDGSNYDEDLQSGNWGTVVDSIMVTPQAASISMVDSCWLNKQIFGTQVTVSLKNPPAAGFNYYLQMVVVEDSVEDWQSDNSTSVQYFVHRFVLRSAINGDWGDELTFTGANVPVTKYYTFTSSNFRYNASAITQPPQVPARLWNMAHCYIVAFLYQRTNPPYGSRDYYVLQAQSLHI